MHLDQEIVLKEIIWTATAPAAQPMPAQGRRNSGH
jgi:hypothetical protein